MQDLSAHGIQPQREVHWDLSTPHLVEHTLLRGEGCVAHQGPIVVSTVPYTGRSPKDKFVVREETTEKDIWWGDVNHPIETEVYEALYDRVAEYLGQQDLYVQDVYAAADPQYRLAVRAITESPWHAHFCRNMFRLPRTYEHDDEIEDRMCYIEHNPVRAELVEKAEDWPYSSAHSSQARLLDRDWYAEMR